MKHIFTPIQKFHLRCMFNEYICTRVLCNRISGWMYDCDIYIYMCVCIRIFPHQPRSSLPQIHIYTVYICTVHSAHQWHCKQSSIIIF